MPGFLDPHAVSIQAEYARYFDADILGKIVFKNFALNVLKLGEHHIEIPISRRGDLGTYKSSCDAKIRFDNRWYSVETKCSRWIVDPRRKIDPSPRWLFSKLRQSAIGTQRCDYDLVFAVGLDGPGLEDPLGYWKHLLSLQKKHKAEGRTFDVSAWPHERAFLDRCGIYIWPREAISLNYLSITIRSLSRRPDSKFFAWGYEEQSLKNAWMKALHIINSPTVANG